MNQHKNAVHFVLTKEQAVQLIKEKITRIRHYYELSKVADRIIKDRQSA